MYNFSSGKPILKILDLCCYSGGASVGYAQAASQLNLKFHITGVDLRPPGNYPFDYVQYDCIKFVKEYGHLYNFIHASPPCQFKSVGTSHARSQGKSYPDILSPLLVQLQKLDKPFIIENVPPAIPFPDLKLNGIIFGLNVIRWRHFMAHRLMLLSPFTYKIRGAVEKGQALTIAGLRSGTKFSDKYRPTGIDASDYVTQWQYALDISWMKTRRELKECIPPAYTKYIGLQAFPQIFPG